MDCARFVFLWFCHGDGGRAGLPALLEEKILRGGLALCYWDRLRPFMMIDKTGGEGGVTGGAIRVLSRESGMGSRESLPGKKGSGSVSRYGNAQH